MRTIPKINSSGTLPVNAQKNSYPPPRPQEPLPAPPVPPPPLGPKPSPVLESVIDNPLEFESIFIVVYCPLTDVPKLPEDITAG